MVGCADQDEDLQTAEIDQEVLTNVTIDHVDVGNYTAAGAHSAADKSYKVGNFAGDRADYFVFDIPSSASSATTAKLVAKNGGCGQVGGAGFGVLRLHEVLIGAAQVSATQTNRNDIYQDLELGPEYGNLSVSGATITAPTITVNLNATGLAAVKKAAGSRMVIGGQYNDFSATLFDHTECDPTPQSAQLIITVDNQAPIAHCHDVTTCAPNGSCSATASVDNGSFDPDGDPLTITQTPVSPYPIGSQLVQLTVTDSKGSSASCFGTVTVTDCQAPTTTCPGPVTAECTGSKQAFFTPPPATATDLCTSTNTTTPLAQSFPLGTTPMTYTGTDSAGNSSSCNFTVTVVDTKPPVLQCAANQQLECTGNNQAPGTVANPQAADICSSVAITGSSPSIFPMGVTSVPFSAVDESGNTSSCASTVTVVDTTPPAISCPASQTAECTGNHQATINLGQATASDVCTTSSVNQVPSASYPVGSTAVTYTATDAHGLSSTCQATATVVDTLPPAISCPAPVTAECTANGAAAVNPGTALAADVCGTVAVDNAPTGSYPVGTTATVFTATDDAGHTASCSSSVTVVDTTPPSISCPAAVTVECTANGAANANPGHATAADACGGTTVTDATSGSFHLGTTSTSFSAVDAAGHTTSCSSTVTVVDTTAPTISCPAAVVVECTGQNKATVDLPAATTSDSCTSATATDPAATAYTLGATNVAFNATDTSGNAASCSTTVTVVDTHAPTITNVPLGITTEATGTAGTPVSVPMPTATDSCQGNLTVSSNAPALFPIGTTTVTFTAVDASGNIATATTTVSVTDSQAPIFSNVPPPVTIAKNHGNGATYTVPLPTATDANDGPVPVTSNAPAVFPVGTTTVTFTATDSHGNTATATTTVTVSKNKKGPSITQLSVSPALVSKNDHKMQAVTVSVTAVDDIDTTAPTCHITSINSNQGEGTCGEHHNDHDFKITGALTAEVRRERSHNQDRIYTLTVECVDSDANTTSATTTVRIKKQH